MSIKGTLIAASVAGLFTGAASLAFAADKEGGEIMCAGVNSCKGQGACSGADHSCAGKNGCKGKGVMKMSKEDCKAKGGKVAKSKEAK